MSLARRAGWCVSLVWAVAGLTSAAHADDTKPAPAPNPAVTKPATPQPEKAKPVAAKPAPATVADDEFLEFLGSVDAEGADQDWLDYLSRTDIEQVAKAKKK